MAEMCACGEPLHYTRPDIRRWVEEVVRRHGRDVLITNSKGDGWKVPRHYIALHGISEKDLPALAEQYGWPRG